MEGLIQISKLNDFLYSPKSLYFHTAFEDFEKQVYQEIYQTEGLHNHRTIDTDKYSSMKDVLQGITVYSEELGLIGKIDLFFTKTYTLIERKTQIKEIFPGYKMQIFAQYFCLLEMGYQVDKLELQSLKDNKKYKLDLPKTKEKNELKKLISDIQNYDPSKYYNQWQTENKDDNTIYNTLYF
jgi:CRISPR-associated exonuclease Cas4